jgi:hypothetical protein
VPLTFHRVNRDPPRRLHWSLSRVPFAPTPNPAITHPNTAHLLLLRRKPIGLPVPLRIQTWRICRVVQAFDPSGAHVNSAESDSAVRCKHGEFDSSHAQISSLLVRRGIGRSRRAHHAAAGDGSWPGLAAQLLTTPTLEQLGGGLASGMQYRNRPDHVTHDRCYRGAKRPPTRLIQCIIESFSESLLIFVADPITVRSCTNRFRSRRAPVWDYQLTLAAAPLQPPPPRVFGGLCCWPSSSWLTTPHNLHSNSD